MNSNHAEQDQGFGAKARGWIQSSFGFAFYLVTAVSLSSIIIRWAMLPHRWVVVLVVAAAISAIFTFLLVPNKLDPRLKRAVAVGLAIASLTTAIAAVPRKPPALPEVIHTVGPPVNGDPIAAKVWFDNPWCEGFAIESSMLRSLPNLDELDTRWVYSHGGATYTWGEVLIEGATEPNVKLERIQVVELERYPPVPNAVALLPCSPLPG